MTLPTASKKMRLFTNTAMVLCTILLSLAIALSAFLSGFTSIPGDNKAISITAHNISLGHKNTFSKGSYIPIESEVIFILAIGNDYRPGVEGKRADAIHVVGVNTNSKQATIINFPRDTTVAIPGKGRNKINAANAYGGSDLTRQTLEQLMDIKISYTLEVDFAGFTGLVDNLGGLDVPVAKSMHDRMSGTNFDPGIVRMDGGQALAFSRDRYSFSDGDISRSTNQGILLIAALNELQKSKNSITQKFESASIIAQHASLANLTIKDLFFFMELANSFNVNEVSNTTVPWSGSNTLAPKANDLFLDFKDNAILDTYR